LGFKKTISLGNLKARRDWGFAGDYVRAMWLMLQQDAPRDYVIGSGELHTVEEMCQIAFGHVGLDYRDHVRQDPRYFRQVEHYDLVADPTEAVQNLKWEREVDFESMIKLMVDSDLELLKKSHPGAEFTP
jgi:GDPmannose 4,6-dehydratase